MITSIILASIWNTIVGWFFAFWPWILGVASAVLAFLFSPAIRKYTIAIIAGALILGIVFMLGYNSNHSVQTVTHACTEFSKHLKIDAKALNTMKRHGLCQ